MLKNIKLKLINQTILDRNKLPAYATSGSAGLNLIACISDPLTLMPGEAVLIPSGIAIFIENPNYAGFIYPRSGLGHKHGIVLGNGVGVIDSDYQGEIKISCLNRSTEPYTIAPADRIAQLVIQPVNQIVWDVVDSFDESSKRADGGFGHTGKH